MTAAAAAIRGMDLPPPGAKCGWHEDRPSTWVCPRCGAFACRACARRVRADALPMCPGCWQRRAELVTSLAHSAGTGLQTAALVLGGVSLLPFWPVQLVSLAIGIGAVIQARGPARVHARTRAWWGSASRWWGSPSRWPSSPGSSPRPCTTPITRGPRPDPPDAKRPRPWDGPRPRISERRAGQAALATCCSSVFSSRSTFLASPKIIRLLGMSNRSFLMPAKPGERLRLMTKTVLAWCTLRMGIP